MKRALFVALALLGGCQQKIQHDLDEGQANEIGTLLQLSGIDAHKVRQGGREARWSIAVPAGHSAAAIKLLADHDLPRRRAPGFGEIFGGGSMVATAIEENALYLHALSGELSRTLTSLDGVVDARVHVVAAPVGPQSALRQPIRPRAAVLLKVLGDRAEGLAARRSELQALVAGSVEGLEPLNVSIMFSSLAANPPVRPIPRGSGAVRVTLIAAASLVALLAAALVLAVIHGRRLRLRLAAAKAECCEDPTPASAPNRAA